MDYDTQAQLSDLRRRVADLEQLLTSILEQLPDQPEDEPVLESMHKRFAGRLKGQR